MTGRETHFELFLRKTPKSDWALSDAYPDRQTAIEQARELVRKYPNGGVRVLKENRDADSGDYNSVVVSTVGHCDDPRPNRKREKRLSATAACNSPRDLLEPAARKTIQEVMPRFLEKNRVLPGELVFRTDLLDQLEANGTEITQAIQRVAISRSDGGDDLHAIARQLHDLVTDGINQVFRESKAGRYLKWDKSLQNMVRKARKKPDPQLAFTSALVDRLKCEVNWKDKLAQLLIIWEEAEQLEEADRAFCNNVLTHYFSEWIEAPNTLGFMIGKTENAGEVVHRLISVLEPRPETPQPNDPLASLPSAQTLARAIGLGLLPSARNRIISLVFEELKSAKRLQPNDLQIEFQLLKNFGDRLVKLLRGERQAEMYEAFCIRSRTLMTIEDVQSYLERFDISERPMRLLDLSTNLAGDDARSKMVAVLRGLISQTQFEVAILGAKNPIMALSTLRGTQIRLLNAKLPDQDRLHGARDLDTLGVRVIGQSKLFRNMAKKAGTPEKAALALFRLAAEALPQGQCAALAASAAQKILQADDARARLDGHPDMKLALAQMARSAQDASEMKLAG